MREWADFELVEDGNGRTTMVLSGPLLVSTVGVLDRELRDMADVVDIVDLSACPAVDTVGAWTIWRYVRDSGAAIIGASREADHLIEAVRSNASTAELTPPKVPLFELLPVALGNLLYDWRDGVIRWLGFLGEVLAGIGRILFRPKRWRVAALIRQIELVGVDALGIIGLMSFLIGIVIAQQGAEQLRQFGAEIYTINLTGRLAMRELGVLMTSIMVAGRSGSAFAAQIGTMKLTEEVDAMRTIGVRPVEALIVPRIMATVLMMPLLGFYAAIMAIIGGAFIADLTLGIPFFTFLVRIQEVVPTYDIWVGLIKAVVFGLIIGVAGTYQGMQVEGNSEEVGTRTTMAVVQGIFVVIVLDAFFAVFFTKVGWG